MQRTTHIDNKYTPRQKTEAVELYRGGMNSDKVARKVLVKAYTVRKWAEEAGILRGRGGHGLKPKKNGAVPPARKSSNEPYPADFKAKAISMVKSGMNSQVVAKQLGVSAFSVRQWVRHEGRSPRPTPRVMGKPTKRYGPSVSPETRTLNDSLAEQIKASGLADRIEALIRDTIEPIWNEQRKRILEALK